MKLFPKFRRTLRTSGRPRLKFRQRKRRANLRISTTRLGLRKKPTHKGQIVHTKPGVGRTARPRPIGKHWLNKPDVIVCEDKREICNPATLGGQYEYNLRIWLMWVRQDGKCCNCRRKLSMRDATFEHEHGRTKARRDDRIVIYEDYRFIRHINGASHGACNYKRGSQRTPIFHGNNAVVEERATQ